jgi:hypothetical protein
MESQYNRRTASILLPAVALFLCVGCGDSAPIAPQSSAETSSATSTELSLETESEIPKSIPITIPATIEISGEITATPVQKPRIPLTPEFQQTIRDMEQRADREYQESIDWLREHNPTFGD